MPVRWTEQSHPLLLLVSNPQMPLLIVEEGRHWDYYISLSNRLELSQLQVFQYCEETGTEIVGDTVEKYFLLSLCFCPVTASEAGLIFAISGFTKQCQSW